MAAARKAKKKPKRGKGAGEEKRKKVKVSPGRAKAKPRRLSGKSKAKSSASGRASSRSSKKSRGPEKTRAKAVRAKAGKVTKAGSRSKSSSVRTPKKPVRKRTKKVEVAKRKRPSSPPKPKSKRALPSRRVKRPIGKAVATSAKKKVAPKQKKPIRKAAPKKSAQKATSKIVASKISAVQRIQIKLKAKLEEAKKAKRGQAIQKFIPAVEALLEKGIAEESVEQKELQRRERILRIWRADRKKAVPSKQAIAFFEERGSWIQDEEDKTIMGTVSEDVPVHAEKSPVRIGYFLRDWLEPAHRALKREPFWFALGFTISGVKKDKKKNYDKIGGRTATISYWYDNRKGARFAGQALQRLQLHFEGPVAENLIASGKRILRVWLFAHYGPFRPKAKF